MRALLAVLCLVIVAPLFADTAKPSDTSYAAVSAGIFISDFTIDGEGSSGTEDLGYIFTKYGIAYKRNDIAIDCYILNYGGGVKSSEKAPEKKGFYASFIHTDDRFVLNASIQNLNYFMTSPFVDPVAIKHTKGYAQAGYLLTPEFLPLSYKGLFINHSTPVPQNRYLGVGLLTSIVSSCGYVKMGAGRKFEDTSDRKFNDMLLNYQGHTISAGGCRLTPMMSIRDVLIPRHFADVMGFFFVGLSADFVTCSYGNIELDRNIRAAGFQILPSAISEFFCGIGTAGRSFMILGKVYLSGERCAADYKYDQQMYKIIDPGNMGVQLEIGIGF